MVANIFLYAKLMEIYFLCIIISHIPD